ncbi:MAG: glycosyltransferase family 39 protein [Armatimonadetes bacterium]|nr:glycosyltransferase family 39 protein [Armatimonadota bacterium]
MKLKFTSLFYILSLGLFLRLITLTNNSFWVDEAFSIFAAKLSLTNLVLFIKNVDAHPPLYYIILHFWIKFFGESEFSSRLLSTIIGILVIYFQYLLGAELFNRKIGLIGAGLIAISSKVIQFDQEARMYPLFFLLSLISFFCLSKLIFQNNKKYWIRFILANILMFYAHYNSILIIISQNILILFFYYKKISIKKWLLSQLILILTILPGILLFLSQIQGKAGKILTSPTLEDFFYFFYTLNGGESIYFPNFLRIFIDIIFGGLIVYVILEFKFLKEKIIFLYSYLFFPLFLSLGISIFTPIHIFSYRHSSFIFPAYFLVLGLGILKLFEKKRKIILNIIIILFFFLNLFSFLNNGFIKMYQTADWKEAALFLKKNFSNYKTLFILQHFYSYHAFSYYSQNLNNLYFLNIYNLYPKLKENKIFLGKAFFRKNNFKISKDGTLAEIAKKYQYICLIQNQEWYEDPRLYLKDYLDKHYFYLGYQVFLNYQRTKIIQIHIYKT